MTDVTANNLGLDYLLELVGRYSLWTMAIGQNLKLRKLGQATRFLTALNTREPCMIEITQELLVMIMLMELKPIKESLKQRKLSGITSMKEVLLRHMNLKVPVNF